MDADRRAAALFTARFGAPPAFLARAPGRVNLIGDHTDYNDGFVLPMALELSTWIAARPRRDGRVVCHSEAFDHSADFVLAELQQPGDAAEWQRYLEGVGWALAAGSAEIAGWDGAVATDVPLGAGLSSSAALEMAAARAFLADRDWDPSAAALAGRRAENEWVGVATGIMDQLVSAAAVEGHALLIDCRSLAIRPIRLPAGTCVFVLDTTTRRDLTASDYDERRGECQEGATVLGVDALRDVTEEDVERRAEDLGPRLEARCRHVVSENARVEQAVAALEAGDAAAVGELMVQSHRSLRDDFEISTLVMEAMVRAATRATGCFGARMTGGGFGGSAVALVDADQAEAFVTEAAAGFRSTTGLTCDVYRTEGGPGTSLTVLG